MFRAFLFLKDRAIPFRKLPGRRLAHVAELGQPPVWRLAPAFEAQASGLGHDNEAVMLKFAKPTHDVTAGAVLPEFFFGIARGHPDRILQRATARRAIAPSKLPF